MMFIRCTLLYSFALVAQKTVTCAPYLQSAGTLPTLLSICLDRVSYYVDEGNGAWNRDKEILDSLNYCKRIFKQVQKQDIQAYVPRRFRVAVLVSNVQWKDYQVALSKWMVNPDVNLVLKDILTI